MPGSEFTNSIVIKPFSREELAGFRRLGRSPARFPDLAEAVQRMQLLRTLRSECLDSEAAIGARLAEAVALSALARSPAPDSDGLRLKAQLFASARPEADGNLTVILEASIAADAERLARAPRAARCSGRAAPAAVEPLGLVP